MYEHEDTLSYTPKRPAIRRIRSVQPVESKREPRRRADNKERTPYELARAAVDRSDAA